MFYQETLPKFPVLIAHLQSEIDTGEKPLRSKKPNQQIDLQLHGNRCLFMWGAYFCMGAYKHDVVAVIKMGAYIHAYGVLSLCGCLLSRF